jgi:DNA repair protein RadD
MAELRDYQKRGMRMLYEWFEKNDGHPCLVMPTGSGKSHIIAQIVKDAMQWSGTRVLMLTHVKELIEQNAAKLRAVWPNAPLGIYSAGLGKRELGEPIIFGGVQSLRNKSELIGFVDLIIIDEAHLINHDAEGGYRRLIADLTAINPDLRVIGLTATPYRLGHGLITDAPAIFSDLIEVVTIEELVHKGQLAILKSKITEARLDVSGVHKRGGDYIEKELQEAVDTAINNSAVVDEIISLAGDRKAWLIFCAGVDHSRHIAELLNDRGIQTACITGATPKAERADILARYKASEIRAVTNANVLTTGFDYPDIDLIAMLRPTMSPGLYVQMAGRGLRLKSHTDHCLVLDFAGVVSQHGPITGVKTPEKKPGNGKGDSPVKACPECHELVAISTRVCPDCGYVFPLQALNNKFELHNDDIMGLKVCPKCRKIHGTLAINCECGYEFDDVDPEDIKRKANSSQREMKVSRWAWFVHKSKGSGKPCLAVTYSSGDSHMTEYFTVWHPGYPGEKSRKTLFNKALGGVYALIDGELEGVDVFGGMVKENGEIDQDKALEFAELVTESVKPPRSITYEYDGKFPRIIKREF